MRTKTYPSDISKEQFELIRPLLEQARRKTKPRTVDICGEGRAPARADLLRLAREGGVSAPAAQTSIERIATVAQDFATHAARWPIRAATVQTLAQSVAANLQRVSA